MYLYDISLVYVAKILHYDNFSEASKYLVEVFNHVEEAERDEILEKMIEIIQKQPCEFV